MENKFGEFIGVDSLYYALVNTDTISEYTSAVPIYLAPVADIGGEPEISNKTTYYDNKAANNYVTEGKTDVKLVVANIPAILMATLLGKLYDDTTGRVYDSGEPNPPDVALGFRYNMGKGEFRYYWFLKGTFSGGAEEATTKKNDIEIKTYTLTYTAVTTSYVFTVGATQVSLKRIFADTADVAFDPTGWFSQVQTPASVGAPDAFTLDSSNPLDNDIDVAITKSPELTFSNKIDVYAITMINTGTMAVIAATISLDTSGKIITIDPTSNLSLDTEYAIIISNVTDIYGQELLDTVITFTTVAV